MIDLDATVLAAASNAFGEFATWSPPDFPAGVRVPVIFWDRAVEEKERDGVIVNEIATILSVRVSSFPRLPVQGDPFLLRGVAYTVFEVLPDGAGAAKLRIRYANDAQASVVPGAPVPVAP